MGIELRPCAGEAILCDPAVTGEFAEEMSKLAVTVQVPPWCGYIGWLAEHPVGFGGFKSAPCLHGSVEIGYLTFPAHERSGVATGVAAGLVAIARLQGASLVVAHTLPFENASTKVLARNSFERTGEAVDPDAGPVWRWELSLRTNP